MWLITLRKAAEFVWDVVTLAFLFSPIIAFAVSATVGIGRLLGLGSDGQIAFIIITVCGIPMFIAVRWRQGARREDEAARLEAKRQAEGQRARQRSKGQRKRALVGEWVQIESQWEAQDKKGQPRNPPVMVLIRKLRELADEESNPEEKAWLMDSIERLQREPNWIRPVSTICHQKEEVNAGEQETKPTEPVSADPTIDEMWQGTGGPPKPGRNWIRSTWPNEATDFTPWLAKHLELVSICTGLDLRFEGAEVYAGGGRADIVARDRKSKSKVVIENQLDAADLDHRKQLALYGEALNARIRIWIAADFSPTICREVRHQNWQNESRSGGAIYYLLKLRRDQISPISLVEGPRSSQARQDFCERLT